MITKKFGVKIGAKHSYTDFGLIMTKKTIGAPTAQTKFVQVSGRDGSIDMTEAVTGDVRYNSRTIEMTFTTAKKPEQFADLYADLLTAWQGKKLHIIIDDEPAYYWDGRVNIEMENSGRSAEIKITAEVDPFKYDTVASDVDWEWDAFDFENGLINETGNLVISGTTSVTLFCKRARQFPEFTCSAAMTMDFNGQTYSLKAGTQKLYRVFFVEGDNRMTFHGNGTLSIHYIGGTL